MKTRQLATYMITALAVTAVLFGFVPPLLNAKSTLLNAVGAGLAVVTLLAAVLTAHHALNQKEQ